MVNIRQSIDNHREFSRQERSTITAIDDATRMLENNIEITDEENRVERFEDQEADDYLDRRSIREYIDPTLQSPCISPRVSPIGSSRTHVDVSNNSMTLNRPNDSGDIESAFSSSSNIVGRERIKSMHPTTPSPFVSPGVSRNNSLPRTIDISSSSGSNKNTTFNRHKERGDVENTSASSANIGGGGVEIDNIVRVKPSGSHKNATPNSIVPLGSPVSGSNDDHHSMMDHIPLARQNSLEMNLANYETAHLLSDKIVVVFVQVLTLTHTTFT